MEIRFAGIRHHGPGSTKNLVYLLEQFDPDAILIEMPQETEALFEHIGSALLKAPVSILVHDKKDPSRVSYLPFTTFSPEWQAIQWANKHEKKVHAIDLPLGYFKAAENYKQGLLKDFKSLKFSNPLAQMAQLAGFSDMEKWWNETFEQHSEEQDSFHLIEYMMDNLRDLDEPSNKETLVREAFMREQIRAQAKQDYARVLVVVGAWHIPAVKQWNSIKAASDKLLLKPLKKIKVDQFFIPWSYEQISISSGYRAGVFSPAWYEHLYKYNDEAPDRWLILAGRLLRQKGFVISPAQIADAALLARQLAQMRQLRIPGILECWDAIQSIMGTGNRAILNLVWSDLVIGKTVGKVDQSILAAPLFKDLEVQLKKARLSAVLKTSDRLKKELDLRKASHLHASRLFHRLHILDIPFAQLRKTSNAKKGSFSEHWSLKWTDSCMIKLSEAGVWGTQIELAAAHKLEHKTGSSEHLGQLVGYLEQSLQAQLASVFESIVDRIFEVLVFNDEPRQILTLIAPLVNMLRYGDLRKMNQSSILELLERLVPNVCSYLPESSAHISEEDAELYVDELMEFNHALDLLEESDYVEQFHAALMRIVKMDQMSAEVQAACIRLLLDKRLLDDTFVLLFLNKVLTGAQDWAYAAAWLKGFLRSNPDLFIYNEPFRVLVDQWVNQLSEDHFRSALPTLRKAFASMQRSSAGQLLTALETPNSGMIGMEESIFEGHPTWEATLRSILHI